MSLKLKVGDKFRVTDPRFWQVAGTQWEGVLEVFEVWEGGCVSAYDPRYPGDENKAGLFFAEEVSKVDD